MSDQQAQNTDNTNSVESLTRMHLDSYDQWMAKEEAKAAASWEASYAYRDAGGQYGPTQYLRTPDGSWARAHYTYSRSQPRRAVRTRYQSRRVQSQNWARPAAPSFPSAPYSKGGDTTRRRTLAEVLLGFLGLS